MKGKSNRNLMIHDRRLTMERLHRDLFELVKGERRILDLLLKVPLLVCRNTPTSQRSSSLSTLFHSSELTKRS